jgi:hypothetical protein
MQAADGQQMRQACVAHSVVIRLGNGTAVTTCEGRGDCAG